eukprot:Polyplicarium_translucidae@DN1718_c0_g1_i1.p2
MDEEDGLELLQRLTFTKESPTSHDTSVPEALRLATEIFGGCDGGDQLLLVVSDGRLNKGACRQWVHIAASQSVTPVLVIVDPEGAVRRLREYTRGGGGFRAAAATGGCVQPYLGRDFPF